MQPMLVGTTSIEKSEQLAEFMLSQGYRQIDFEEPQALRKLYAAARSGTPSKLFAVLNARFHEQEAYIVAEAGVPGAITVATNMAGRGTDIQLGGNVEMRVAHELAGMEPGPAAGRQGSRNTRRNRRFQGKGHRRRRPLHHRHRTPREPPHRQPAARPLRPPGRSRPFQILPVAAGRSDAHFRVGPHGFDADTPRPQEDEAIVHPWINKALEKAQQKVEQRNFDMRKNILKYDNVMNDQRKVVFEQRAAR